MARHLQPGDPRIRVLHFVHVINRYDFLDNLLVSMDRRRYEVLGVAAMPPRLPLPYAPEEQYPIRCLNIPLVASNYPRLLLALWRAIRDFRPHIVHAHHYHGNVLASLAAKMADVPAYIVGRHHTDHIYLLTRGVKRAAYLALEAAFNTVADKIVVPIDGDAQLLVRRQHVAKGKVSVIPLGFDLNRCSRSTPDGPATLRRQLGLDGCRVLMACCRLNPEKGLDTLLLAMAAVSRRHPAVRLVIVGSGACEQALRRQSAELGLEHMVQFVGWQDNPIDWLALADIFIQPSRSEAFCQVLLEALGLRKPVIMTPVGAAPEVIGQNERGRLFPIGDVGGLAAAIEELLANPALAAQLGEAGYRYVRDHLSPNAIARQHEDLYRKVAASVMIRERGRIAARN